MRSRYTMVVGCSPEHLWPFIEQPELQKRWMKGLLENTHTGGAEAGQPGSTFHMRIQEGGRVAEYDGEVVARDEPGHLAVTFWGGSFPDDMKMRVDYRLIAEGDRTRLDYEAAMVSGRFPLAVRLLLPLIKLFSYLQLRGFMRTLKGLAEA